MLKFKTFWACLFLVSSVGLSTAAPPDSPDVVIIDGVACGRFCQTYMGWFRKHFGEPAAKDSQSGVPLQAPAAEVSSATKNNAKRPASTFIAKPTATQSGIQRPNETSAARMNRMGDSVAVPETTAAPKVAITSPTALKPPAQAAIPPVQDLTGAVPSSETSAAFSLSANSTTETKTVTQSPAGQATPAPPSAAPPYPAVPKLAETPKEPSDPVGATSSGDPKPSPLSVANADQVIAVLYVRESIRSVSDLANKVVAVDPSNATSRIKTAVETAGAPGVQLIEGARMALLRVIDGEVPAAIVKLETPQQAATWTDVPGLRVLRIPLAPAKAGPG